MSEQRHQDVGHREVRLPHVKDRDRQEGGRDEAGRVVGDPPRQPEEHDDRHRAGHGDERSREHEQLGVGQHRVGKSAHRIPDATSKIAAST